MSFLKQKLGRITGPALVCTAIVAVLGITAAVAAPQFVTGKKVVTTIVKKVQGQELQVASEKQLNFASTDLNNPAALIADMKLPKGSYMFRMTANVQRTAGLTVTCELRANKRVDRTSLTGPVAVHESISLGISAGTPAGGGAQLRCADGTAGLDGIVRSIEIAALRVPKLTLSFAP